jgi:hypothetical protein
VFHWDGAVTSPGRSTWPSNCSSPTPHHAPDGHGAAVSADRRAVTFTLPPPRLTPVSLDPAATRIVGRERGLVERLAGVVASNPVDDEELYQLAAQRIDDAARQSDLITRAQANTNQMLTSLARSLGYEQVTVTFDDPR